MTVIEGYLVRDPERAWRAKWAPPWVRMELSGDFTQCHIYLDGEEIMARAMWVRVNPPGRTEVGFTRLVRLDYESTDGPPLRGFSPPDHEVTGYLLDEAPTKPE